MKKLFVIVAILSALIACSKEEVVQATDADVVDVVDSEVVSPAVDVTTVVLSSDSSAVN
jgi:uncharacterized protein YcfL